MWLREGRGFWTLPRCGGLRGDPGLFWGSLLAHIPLQGSHVAVPTWFGDRLPHIRNPFC